MKDLQGEAVAAARLLREELGLGLDAPLPDLLLEIVEEHAACAVPVTLLPMPETVAGAYLRREGQRFIFINSDQWPVRRRFTLAHELGHIRLGHTPMVDFEADIFDTKAANEIQANAFAAEFLAPVQAVRNWLDARLPRPWDVTLETVVRLANYFRISAQVAVYRLDAADAFKKATEKKALEESVLAGEHLSLQRHLDLHDKPGPNGRDDIGKIGLGELRPPGRALQSALRGFQFGLIEPDRAAELLAIDPEAFKALAAEREIAPVSASADEFEPASFDDEDDFEPAPIDDDASD